MLPDRFGFLKSVFLALFLFVGSAFSLWADETFAVDDFSIVTSDGIVHPFLVEIAETEPQRAQGLMYRREMAADNGMLFIFGQTRTVRMWMKNTYLPLDMLFIDKQGRIVTIAENAEPLSETIIESGAEVDFVLELNAGTVAKLKIKTGDLTWRGSKSPVSGPAQ